MSSSSGYKGKFWKAPQDRGGGGAPNHQDRPREATPERGRGRAESQTPFLSEVTAQNMEKYIAAVHQFTLSSKAHDALAPWIRGRIPEVMLEFPLQRSKEKLLGLAAKHNILKDGTISTKNLTAMEVRYELISKTIVEDEYRRIEEKKQLQNLLGDPHGEIGSSSMDAESNSKDKQRSPPIGTGKDSSMKTGSSVMDASRSAKDPATERASKSEEEEPPDYEAYYNDALNSIWPHSSKKTRENERGNLQSAVQSLLGLMVYGWPAKEIQLRMLATRPLMSAFEGNDLILFIDELKAFALAGTGNVEANREAAEKHLEQVKMKSGGALDYFKEFTEAVEHIRVCRSSFSELRVVDLFFRHLDQVSFPGWWAKSLTTDDTLHKFRAKPFEEAREHAKRYFDMVIRVVEVRKEPDNKKQAPRSNTITNIETLSRQLAVNKGGPITIDLPVLATYIQGLTGKKRTREEKAKADKAKTDALKANADGTKNKKAKVEGDKTEKNICFAFRDDGKCKYGAQCYFSHVKA